MAVDGARQGAPGLPVVGRAATAGVLVNVGVAVGVAVAVKVAELEGVATVVATRVEVAVAEDVGVALGVGVPVGVTVGVIVGVLVATLLVMEWVTVAGWYEAFPACAAMTTHVPAPTMARLFGLPDPESEHTLAGPADRVMVRPELTVAVTASAGAPRRMAVGSGLRAMVCVRYPPS